MSALCMLKNRNRQEETIRRDDQRDRGKLGVTMLMNIKKYVRSAVLKYGFLAVTSFLLSQLYC